MNASICQNLNHESYLNVTKIENNNSNWKIKIVMHMLAH